MPEKNVEVDFDLVDKIIEKARRIFAASPSYKDIVKGNVFVNLEYAESGYHLKNVMFVNGEAKITVLCNAVLAQTVKGSERLVFQYASFDEFVNL